MDTEKAETEKAETEKTESQKNGHDKSSTEEKEKQSIGDIVGDLVVSATTVLAHSAAQAVVGSVKKAAAKSAPAKPVLTPP
jgi:translation initiation factor 2B subunit (eIF-2B alpha/beta/delta family)